VSEVIIAWLQRGMTDAPEVLIDHLTYLATSLLGGLE
jgi:hypothetical protein